VKRLVLLFAALGVALAIVGLTFTGNESLTDSQEADAQIAERPNFVFVMADDLDERSMDQLGGVRSVMNANGMTFENAYVTYSLCCPSRASILRGQYPHNHGIIGNGLPEGGEKKFRNLGLDKSTIATWLNNAGYQTKLVGKYMNSYYDLYIPPGWDEWYAMIGDHWNLSDPATGKMNNNGQQTTVGGHSTDVFADKASDFIRRSSTNAAPFFLWVGTKAPHSPPEVATRYQSEFTTTPLPKPPNFNEADVSDKPAWVQSRSIHSPTRIAEFQQEYRARLRSMLSVEDLLRKTIATLQQTGELNNTYIFFTSDNGYHLGNHRLGLGKRAPYEEDIGVPLMVRGPGVPAGAVRQELVLNNDFAPTIAQLAGASIPDPQQVDGSSFAPLLSNPQEPTNWRTAFLEEGWRPQSPPIPTHKSVHTQDHMFTEYSTGERELYDLNADPYQERSIKQTTAPQLYSTLQSRLNALRACSGDGCRSAEGFSGTPPPPPPETSPSVTSTVPKAGATGVAPSSNLTATFSEKMDPASITTSTFKLFKVNPDGTQTQITNVTVALSTDGLVATLNPFGSSTTMHLASGTKYKGVITTGARDVAGNPLDQIPTAAGLQMKAWTFTVSP
jgi:N-acetylglucosamine-6-sulfatase